MGSLHERRFPGEDASYRAARDRLLEAERELRAQMEMVAEMRRELPPGGPLPEDYAFEEMVEGSPSARRVRFSELFGADHDTLVIYSFMYPPGRTPCPMCTAFLDGLDGSARHLRARVALAVVAAAPAVELAAFGRRRGWRFLRLLCTGDSGYSRAYFGENAQGCQLPMLNVFRRDGAVIRHFWGSEVMFTDALPGQEPRHLDLHWPLWTVLDLAPGGRGADWYPDVG